VESAGTARHGFGSFGEIAGGNHFSLGVDNRGPFFSLGFSLFGHGANHGFGKLDIFKLDGFDVDAPGVGGFVDDLKDGVGDFFSIAEKLIEGGFADDSTHGGLSQLRDGPENILNFVDGFTSIGDFVVNNGIHFAGNVVFGDGFLFGDVDGLGSDIDLTESLKDGPDQAPTGSDDTSEATHGVNDATFIFVNLFERS